MIEINNELGKDIKCFFQYEGETIGECTNHLSFIDVLCQIKAEKSNKYQLLVEKTDKYGNKKIIIYKINSEGKLSPSHVPNVTLWNDIFNTQLLFLTGYTNNVNYENK